MMDKRKIKKHEKGLELLTALGEIMLPRGFRIIDSGPDKSPGLAPDLEGAAGGPIYRVDIGDRVIRELARRAIKAGIGAEIIPPQAIHFHIESDGTESVKMEPSGKEDAKPRPAFMDMLLWYETFKLAGTFKTLGYTRVEIINGLWEYLSGANNEFYFKCIKAWSWPESFIQVMKTRPATYKAAKHLEQQKMGLVPKNNQLSLWDYWEDRGTTGPPESAREVKIECVGLRNLTLGQYKAIEAVQKFISMTDFKGNRPAEYRQTDYFKGYVPAIEFTPAEYYEIRGVSKSKDKAGKWVFNRREREEALKDLMDLEKETFILGLTRPTWKDGKKSIERIHTPNARLWTYNEHYRGLTEKENEALSRGGQGRAGTPRGRKLIKIYLTNLSPIFVDQQKTHFIIKPSRYKALADCSSKYPFMFFDWLQIEADNRRRAKITDWIIKADRKDLAYRLELKYLIDSRQKQRINKIILECYALAFDEGMLSNYELDHQGVTKKYDILSLDKEYFEKMGWQLTKPEK